MKNTTLLILSVVCAGMPADSVLAATINLNNATFTSVCESVSSAPNAGCSLSSVAGSGTVNFSLSAVDGPFANASNSSTNAGGNTFGNLVYQILVQGPSPTAEVDVNYLLTVSGQFTSPLGNDEAASLNTGAALTVGPYNIASTSINVTASGGSSENGFPPSLSDNSVNAAYSSQTGAWSGMLSGPQIITLTTGLAYNVDLRVQANCSGQPAGNATISCSTSAMVDPTFTIDSGQPNASQYSLLLSQGVGNGTSAPEPGTIMLFGAGFIGLAIVRFGNGGNLNISRLPNPPPISDNEQFVLHRPNPVRLFDLAEPKEINAERTARLPLPALLRARRAQPER